MIKKFLSRYLPSYATSLVYMLQSVEYQVNPYLSWYKQVTNFNAVMYRRSLEKTRPAKLLLAALSVGMLVQVVAGLGLVYLGNNRAQLPLTLLGMAAILLYPFVWAYLIVLPLVLGRSLIIGPKQRRLIKASKQIFSEHPGIKIAVAGSYGKTSMKELLKTVLSEGKDVAATPANKNVAVSHAYFAARLIGKEDVIIIEYGEGEPGDIARFAKTTQPSIGIITGLAPAHLDNYPSLQAAGEDIFSLADHVDTNKLYVNHDSVATHKFIKPGYRTYDHKSVNGWKIRNIKVDFSGTSFVMEKSDETLRLRSGLLGVHQVGPLALVSALAREFGLSLAQIEAGVAKTHAFEHRMQPRALRGAWILDDTYNGNIDGMKAGLKLLQALPGKRKIYVTPGLVDQGIETQPVHIELGEAIAAAQPDKLVLMLNSVTDNIKDGLAKGGFSGELQVEHYPLDFYTNLEHFLASGDVIMMQNDWTDNYK